MYIYDPYKWKDNSNIIINRIDKIETLIRSNNKKNKKLFNKIKQLISKTCGEHFRFASYNDPIWIATKKNNLKLLGVCMITKKSPGGYFENENTKNVPYLYNMVIDIYNNKTKVWKVSVSLLMHVRKSFSDLYIRELLESNPSYLNLNVHENNQHAYNFYVKNKFEDVGDCLNESLKNYKMLTLKL